MDVVTDPTADPPDTGIRAADIRVDDAAFVRAPIDLVYRRLTDVAAWSTWWPGLAVRRLPSSPEGQRWAMGMAVSPLFQLRCALRVDRWRPDLGLVFALRGDVHGTGEIWLEVHDGGTVVHALTTATTSLPWPARVARGYRRAVRRGLWGLKDALQLEVRTSLGLTP